MNTTTQRLALAVCALLIAVIALTTGCSDAPVASVDSAAPTAITTSLDEVDAGQPDVGAEAVTLVAPEVVEATAEPAPDAPMARPHPVPSLDEEEVRSTLNVREAAITSAMEARRPTAAGESFTVGETRKLWAFINVENKGQPTTMKMVWKKNGKHHWSTDVKVGTAKGWRTWSYKRVGARDVGSWSVEVYDAGGDLHETMNFTILPAPDAVGAQARR